MSPTGKVISTVTAAALALAACGPAAPSTGEREPVGIGQTEAVPTQYSDANIQAHAIPTPEYNQFDTIASQSPWYTAYEMFGPELVAKFQALDRISDPIAREYVAKIIWGNFQAVNLLDQTVQFEALKEAGRVIGCTTCVDSRIIGANGPFYATTEGSAVPMLYATEDQHSLAGTARLFDPSVKTSIVATHCISPINMGGCGALAAFKQLSEARGREALAHHGISELTITTVLNDIKSADPIIQARAAAQIQAIMNGPEHVTVATIITHTGQWEAVGVFNGLGEELREIPTVIQQLLALNRQPLDAALIAAQKPPVIGINTTNFNTKDLFGADLAGTPGQLFKVTVRPQVGEVLAPTNVAELGAEIGGHIDQAIAGSLYAEAHDWAKVIAIFGQSEADIAPTLKALMNDDVTMRFLARPGAHIAINLTNEKGLIQTVRIIKLAETVDPQAEIAAIRAIGTTSFEIKASELTIAQAQAIAAAETLSPAAKRALDLAQRFGTITFKVLRFLEPLLNAGNAVWVADIWSQMRSWNAEYSRHSFAEIDGQRGGISRVLTSAEYQQRLQQLPDVEPYMWGEFETTYTQAELGTEYLGLVEHYLNDVAEFGGDMTNGPKNEASVFYGMGITDLKKVLNFDYFDITNPGHEHRTFHTVGRPIFFFPLGTSNDFSPDNISLTPDGIKNQPFMVLDPNSGQFVTTDSKSQMIIKIVGNEPLTSNTVYYYLLVSSEGDGQIHTKCVGYEVNPEHADASPYTWTITGNEYWDNNGEPFNPLEWGRLDYQHT